MSYISLLQDQYQYVLVIDVDEFFDTPKYKNIHEFVYNEMYLPKVKCVKLPWVYYTDNDIIWEKDTKSSVIDTYTQQMEYVLNDDGTCKAITNIIDIFQEGLPAQNMENIYNGKCIFENSDDVIPQIHNSPYDDDVSVVYNNHDIAFIRHYRTKCMETFFKQKVAYGI